MRNNNPKYDCDSTKIKEYEARKSQGDMPVQESKKKTSEEKIALCPSRGEVVVEGAGETQGEVGLV